ncbi:MAG: GAF domain-containing protein, partial [Betaproteobacteria bacterium]
MPRLRTRCEGSSKSSGSTEPICSGFLSAPTKPTLPIPGLPPACRRSRPGRSPTATLGVCGTCVAGRPLVLARLDDLPSEAAVDKASWQSVGVKSNLTMPMIVGGRVEGAIAFGCLRRSRDWPDELVAQIRILAEVFANALAHKRAQEALNSAIDFERMASAVLAALLAAGPAEQDSVIVAALRDLAMLLGAERVLLWERLGNQVAFAKSHRWLVAGAATPADSADSVELPWVSAQLVAGSVVSFARHADLPSDASTDLPALAALNVRAAVIVPLAVSGAVVGALAFGTRHEDREWPGVLVPRAKLLGEVFAGVLAR